MLDFRFYSSPKIRICLIPLAFVVALSGCNGGSGGSSGNSDSGNSDSGSSGGSGGGSAGSSSDTGATAGSLDGAWGGVLEDIDYENRDVVTTISDDAVTRVVMDGEETGETGRIRKIGSTIYEYESSDGVTGGIITDPDGTYATMVNENWNFSVLQKEAESPFGTAGMNDLEGAWTGSVFGFVDSSYYTYPAEAQCGSGICVVTATGPARNSSDKIMQDVRDLTGTQTTYTTTHRDSLLFDFDFTSGTDTAGFGTIIMSKDKQFVGSYVCLYGLGTVEECEYGAFWR